MKLRDHPTLSHYLLLLIFATVSTTAPTATAQVDCEIIESIPAKITKRGVYCLDQDHSTDQASGQAIKIKANDVTINFNGFRIQHTGDDTEANGVYAKNKRNITIRGGLIRGFLNGILLEGDDSTSGHLIEGNHIDRSSNHGMQLVGHNIVVRDNVVSNTGRALGDANGIWVRHGTGIVIAGNTVRNTFSGIQTVGIWAYAAPGCFILGNTVTETSATSGASWAIGVGDMSDRCSLQGNVASNTAVNQGTGLGVQASEEVTCKDNSAKNFITPNWNCIDFGTSNHYVPVPGGGQAPLKLSVVAGSTAH